MRGKRNGRRWITGGLVIGWFALAWLLFAPPMSRTSAVSVAVDLPSGVDAEAGDQIVSTLLFVSNLIGPLIALLILFGAAALIYLYARKRHDKEPPP